MEVSWIGLYLQLSSGHALTLCFQYAGVLA